MLRQIDELEEDQREDALNEYIHNMFAVKDSMKFFKHAMKPKYTPKNHKD